jgi:hypothetical protein
MKTISLKSFLSYLLIGTLFILVLAGCSNYEDVSACVDGKTYGFWNGLWHGIIAPIDLVAMIWREDVSVFAPNNNGFWYAFGFVLGSGGWGFLGGRGSKRARRSKEY